MHGVEHRYTPPTNIQSCIQTKSVEIYIRMWTAGKDYNKFWPSLAHGESLLHIPSWEAFIQAEITPNLHHPFPYLLPGPTNPV